MWLNDKNAGLFTDLYQLTMLQAYFLEELDQEAVFDLFIRRLPNRNYLIACGLDTVLHYLETLHFSQNHLDYLDSLGIFQPAFLAYLSDFRFAGDVFAVPEGTPVFPSEPILEVVAPIGQSQIVETFILNQITFQTGIASKGVRVVQAASGRPVADFGMRRMHGADAPLKAARAYFIAGISATSNVLAGHFYGLKVTGTMAHSYVEAHDLEEDAFRVFARTYPNTTLLVDTYDTCNGVQKVVALAREMGDDFNVGAVRLDSGDLVNLAFRTRAILDDAGLPQVKIFASNSLDEHAIAGLLEKGAPIDAFGVGTRMGTMADQPYLDSVYKMCEYAGRETMKLSAFKSNFPGRKQIFRFFENDKMVRDVIASTNETMEGKQLLLKVMEKGERTEEGKKTLHDARRYAAARISQLPPRLRALDISETPYPVEISQGLLEKTQRISNKLKGPEKP